MTRGTFACERATGACVHTVERLTGALPARTIPLSDVLGFGEKHSYWDEAPGAREALARARSMDAVSAESLYVTKPHPERRSTASSTTVVFTRQGLVFLVVGEVVIRFRGPDPSRQPDEPVARRARGTPRRGPTPRAPPAPNPSGRP